MEEILSPEKLFIFLQRKLQSLKQQKLLKKLLIKNISSTDLKSVEDVLFSNNDLSSIDKYKGEITTIYAGNILWKGKYTLTFQSIANFNKIIVLHYQPGTSLNYIQTVDVKEFLLAYSKSSNIKSYLTVFAQNGSNAIGLYLNYDNDPTKYGIYSSSENRTYIEIYGIN